MADVRNLEVLKQGVTAWNRWRQRHPDQVSPDLTEANLQGLNLMGADLTGADLRKADLSAAKLRRADLYGAKVGGANLSNAHGLTALQIAEALGDEGTKLPAGVEKPKRWVGTSPRAQKV